MTPALSLDAWRASFETVALRPPQDEDFSFCHKPTNLILRSASGLPGGRLEGRRLPMQRG
jgi:hypothetical protein